MLRETSESLQGHAGDTASQEEPGLPPLRSVSRGVVASLLHPIAARLWQRSDRQEAWALFEKVRAAAPEVLIPGRELKPLIAALEASGLLGVETVAYFPQASLGVVDYYTMSSATLREGLTRFVQCLKVFTDALPVALVEEGDLARFVLRERNRPRLSRRLAEFFFALVATRCREAVGPRMQFREVAWIHPEMDRKDACEAFFGAPNRFGCEEDALVFDASLLDCALLTSDPSVSLTLDEHVRKVGERARYDAFLEQVRAAVARSLPAAPKVSLLARSLGVSTRTLQRRLSERGTHLQALLDDVRRQRAIALLEDRSVPVALLAERLGFAESAPFFRAFRRWTGTTPAVFRARKDGSARR
ncbi:helix-turn-helix domain-containing protein [Chondromyces apiculatus]|uniref:Transcriptional regulator, AraC family n=1 Tax=Chondromyces apiculatus DSM 436 TaxID=1192034 RepID=A0A017T9I3_9BACT|nr:AraC family transcriptional regulator [Chondromyces apiculatus]EYF05904.1 Transcriptional regulator, AraC family [Chondromyces apiculatus DSM 436]